jgi:hypothetical protein
MYTCGKVWVKIGSHAHSGEAPGEMSNVPDRKFKRYSKADLKCVYLKDLLPSLCMGKLDAFGVRYLGEH